MEEFDYKSFLETLTTRPGVYQMYDEQHKLLYVGKARNLKNRVGSYFSYFEICHAINTITA